MYHRIADDSESNISPYYRLSTAPSRFAEHMAWIAESGRRAVSIERAFAAAKTNPDQLNQLVAVTFDDGYQDFLEHAWPALALHQFSATVYLPTAFIRSQRQSFKGHPCLTWQEVRELRKHGMHFGSHTVHHPVLFHQPWKDIRAELSQSKDTLEQELSESVDAFAYPFAYPEFDAGFTRKFELALQEFGYTSSATTRIGRWRTAGSRLSLPRLPVNTCDDAALFHAKLTGAYDWLRIPQHVAKRLKATLRRSRRPAGVHE
jgi:peptidoglycan/xylan/chitin deacetylase (PgdA/CDA1 family)